VADAVVAVDVGTTLAVLVLVLVLVLGLVRTAARPVA
jgi:hypothetical protein